jgi:hypothetical protein
MMSGFRAWSIGLTGNTNMQLASSKLAENTACLYVLISMKC